MEIPKKTEIVVLPIDVEVDGCIVTLLEATKFTLTHTIYQVSCQARCGDMQSQIFHVTYSTPHELIQKLKTEIAKFKYMIWLLGKEEMIRRGIATRWKETKK